MTCARRGAVVTFYCPKRPKVQEVTATLDGQECRLMVRPIDGYAPEASPYAPQGARPYAEAMIIT